MIAINVTVPPTRRAQVAFVRVKRPKRGRGCQALHIPFPGFLDIYPYLELIAAKADDRTCEIQFGSFAGIEIQGPRFALAATHQADVLHRANAWHTHDLADRVRSAERRPPACLP